ncbi:hypothetical protein PV10_05559 [Exophiala mesophila]|uniref:Uncharacterized protein n=1 Tax=Exophiala mesophila TaxID=212818 RepID=A0A0D1XS75_EXOME|nr:uncharacterized protein PV10_05559 [Exophiala mesophila]KIV90961.1 hypothetical protein PV10_05559 [Exophiala mesophila]
MSNGHYRQQWQQGPEPAQRQYQYERRDDRAHRQEQPPFQQTRKNDYQRYADYPQSRNDAFDSRQGQEPAQFQYEQDNQWVNHDPYLKNGYQDSYAPNATSHKQEFNRAQPQQGHSNGNDRTYQYDERFRANGHPRPSLPQEPSSQSNGSGRSRGQRSERFDGSEPTTPKKSRGRDRILPQPSSPKNLAWDNPFGAFPPKKQKHDERDKERHQSLDKAMDDLSVNDRRYSGGPEVRPQTSHGQRAPPQNRDPPPRPGTSHDRPPELGLMPLAPQYHNLPPGRQSPEMSRRKPAVPPQQSSPRRPPPQMAPRMPPMRSGEDRARQGPSGPVASYNSRAPQDPQSASLGHVRPQREQREQRNLDSGYDRDHIPQSRAYHPPDDISQARSGPQRSATVEGFQHPSRSAPPERFDPPSRTATLERFDPPSRAATFQGYEQAAIPSAAPMNTANTASRDMPNFDAIPAPHEQPDELFGTSPASFDKPYQKQTYQVPGSFPIQLDTRQDQAGYGDAVHSPLADFAFDLPQNTNTRAMTPGRNDTASPSQPYRGYQYGEQNNLDQRAGSLGGQEDGRRQQNASQFPPRAASRPAFQSDHSRPPPMPFTGQDGYRSVSDGQYPRGQQGGPQGAQRSLDMANSYGQRVQQNGRDNHRAGFPHPYGAQDWNQSAPNKVYEQQPFEQRPPLQSRSQENYDVGHVGRPGPPQQPYIRNAHPVPVRNYGPPAPAPTPAPVSVNPDSLPAHPEPARQNNNNYNVGYAANTQQQRQQQPTPGPGNAPRQVSVTGVNGTDAHKEPAITQQELSSLRNQYSRTPGDHALGLKLAKKLVEAARVLADEGGTADPKQTQKNRENYVFEAHKVVKRLVSANYPEAMFYLADCHGQGLLGLAVDPKEAFHLYQSAAKLNHAPSAYRVAVCCELGPDEGGGTRRDPLKAIQWYKRAATLGDTPAMYKMGIILLKGLLGQAKNSREAVSWLKRAAERADKDNPHAVHELGLLYESAAPGDHIIKDERYALQLFTQAAELGYKYSQFRLGSAYEYGLLGLPIDPRQSIAWYTRAAAQGEHQSELALSGWYLTGSEPLLSQSDNEAFLWARKAASSGLAKAEYAMGYFFEVGIGTDVDLEEAKRWYYRAAAQNMPKARERLEELKRGGQRHTKSRVSRSQVNRQSEGECTVM